jgi:hypothetical protein
VSGNAVLIISKPALLRQFQPLAVPAAAENPAWRVSGIILLLFLHFIDVAIAIPNLS